MQFSIIYTCDVPKNTHLVAPPPSQSHLWTCTERSGGPDGEQMEWGFEKDSEWAKGRHRKYCSILNEEQFREFLDHCGLFAEDVETMGSIGAPGFGFGWAPAISFRGDYEELFNGAYVTPMPEEELDPDSDTLVFPGMEDILQDRLETRSRNMWDETKEELLAEYA